MKKNENKTRVTKQSVSDFIAELPDAEVQAEAKQLVRIFKEATGMKPLMWGNMVGFGSYHYKYDTGREGDSLASGFAMRTSGPTIYIMPGYQDYGALLDKLGPHKLGKSCLYLKRLSDVNEAVLKKLIKQGLKDLAKLYPVTRT